MIEDRIFWLIAIVAAVAALLFGALLTSYSARAHTSDTGFEYEAACCSDRDCAPAADSDVVPAAGGWFVPRFNLLVPYDSRIVRRAPDGRFHFCVGVGVRDGAHVEILRCLYVPEFGS